MSKADLRLKDTIEVGTSSRPIRAIIENPPDEVLLTYYHSLEGFLICFVLARLGEYKRSAILKHRGKIPTIYT